MEIIGDTKNELIDGLKKASQSNSRSKTARLREIFEEVETAKESGLSLKTIVAVLADRGLVFDLATFVNVRHRIKKERAVETLNNNLVTTKKLAEVKTISQIKKTTANHFVPDKSVKTNKSSQENNTNQNPLHKLTGEKMVGKFNPIPNTKPEIDEST